MTVDGPRQAVFNTAELLEQILLDLPFKNIFSSQRVSRQFRDCIISSGTIQQKLFLQPSKTPRTMWKLCPTLCDGNQRRRWEIPDNAHWSICDATETLSATEETRSVVPARLNPLLSLLFQYETSVTRHWDVASGERVRLNLDLSIRGNPSRQQTYFSDPPCQSVTVDMDWRLGKQSKVTGYRHYELYDPDGVTLCAAVKALLSEKDTISFDAARSWNIAKETTLDTVLKDLGESRSRKAVLTGRRSYFQLKGIVVPTEEEWTSVR